MSMPNPPLGATPVGNTYQIADTIFTLHGYFTGKTKQSWKVDMLLGVSPNQVRVLTFKYGDRQNYVGKVADAIWQGKGQGRTLLVYLLAVKKLLFKMNEGAIGDGNNRHV